MTLKIPNWLIWVVLIGLSFLISTLIRGCHNSNQAIADNKALSNSLDSVTTKTLRDSIDNVEKEKELHTALDVVNGQLEISENRNSAYRDSLDGASKRIDALNARWNKYAPLIRRNSDSSTSVVPNEFVDNCHDCFLEINKDKELVRRANSAKDSTQSSLQSKINLLVKRGSELSQQNTYLQGTLIDALAIAKKQEEKYAPRGRLYLSLSMAAKNYYYIMGAGGGLLYIDKKQRGYGGNVYGTSIGPMVIASYYLPLSLKRR